MKHRLRARVAADSGVDGDEVDLAFGGFADLEENLRRQVAILRDHPFLGRFAIHGLVFDVSDGRLSELA